MRNGFNAIENKPPYATSKKITTSAEMLLEIEWNVLYDIKSSYNIEIMNVTSLASTNLLILSLSCSCTQTLSFSSSCSFSFFRFYFILADAQFLEIFPLKMHKLNAKTRRFNFVYATKVNLFWQYDANRILIFYAFCLFNAIISYSVSFKYLADIIR